MRPIDADALIDDLEYDIAIDTDILNYVGTEGNERINTQFDKDCKQNAIDLLMNAPTIDAVEVKQGEWIAVDSYSAFGGSEEQWQAHGNPIAYHYCSNCKSQTRLDEFGEEMLTDYCPNCGAKMAKDETQGDCNKCIYKNGDSKHACDNCEGTIPYDGYES